MKRLLTLVLAAMAFVACTQNEVEELTDNRVALPETLTVGFESGDTRVELNEALKTVWSKGDEVSVFFLSDANQKWQYQGETGERLGTLKCIDQGVAEEKMQRVVVAYPYNAQYVVNTDTHNLYASLPAVQSYKEGSYGSEGNIMVAQSEFTQFSLKSVCGWLRIELTGEGQKVDNITLRGNAEEQVAGLIYVDTATAEATLASEMGEASDEEQVGGVGGGLEFDDTIFTEVTLDCGSGVVLSSEAKAFYIGLLPQTFAEGVTIEVNCAGYKPMTLSTESSITIERNHIKPMAAVEYEADSEPTTTANQLRYTATALVEPYNASAFNVTIVSNEWDETTGEGVITFDGELTTIGENAFILCGSLTSVTIGDSVTTIGGYAFNGCSSLTSVTIPDSVTTIGEAAFLDCDSLKSVTIGDSVTTIGEYAFNDCRSLTSITIPDSVTTIGDFAFSWCESLTSVTIGDGVTAIGEAAFASCSSLTEFKGKFAEDGGRCLIKDNAIIAYANASGTTYTIPDSVTTIGYKAFRGCYDLTSITIPDSVTTIGDGAFYWCDSLTSVTIPDSVTTIGDYAFYYCSSLTSVTIGNSVMTIGNYAFGSCSSLTSVTIPDSVTTIGNFAFDSCSNLAEFKGKFAADGGRCLIKDNTLIAYANASGTTYTIPDSVTLIKELAFAYCDDLTSVTIGDSVTTIGEWAFSDCISLTSVYCKATTPPSLGDYVFKYWDSGYVNIGCAIYVPAESVEAYKAASGWSDYAADIVGYDFETGEEVAFSNKLFYTATALVEPYDATAFNVAIVSNEWDEATGEGVITFDGELTTIGGYAFSDCNSLTSVTIPDSVTTIGDGAFCCCHSLAEFNGKFATDGGRCLIIDGVLNAFAIGCGAAEYTIPDSITTIGNFAFYYCTSLTSVTIPDSVTTIGEYAFYYCDRLTSVTIPDSVTTIGYEAFERCSSLTSVYCEATTPPTLGDSYVFDDNASGRKIYVPAESVKAYKAATNWSEYASYIVGYDFETGEEVIVVKSELFYTATALVEPHNTSSFNVAIVSNEWDEATGEGVITFDGELTTIGEWAFHRCDSLTSVTIPNSITTIGVYAFAYCDSLTSVTIPDSVTTIGGGAFSDCNSLTNITIGDSVTTIGNGAFTDCSSLTSVTIPDSVTTIGEWAFEYCISLTSVTIGNSVTTIGDSVFYQCLSLTSVTIPDSVTTIGIRAFYHCDSLTSVTIPDSVTTIGDHAFIYCDSLTSVTIGNSVTSIGDYAFENCSSLTSVYCEATTPPTLGYYVFKYLDNEYVKIGCPIYVPAESVEEYKAAENWSEYAADIVGYNFE